MMKLNKSESQKMLNSFSALLMDILNHRPHDGVEKKRWRLQTMRGSNTKRTFRSFKWQPFWHSPSAAKSASL
jgi:hypothetical protein